MHNHGADIYTAAREFNIDKNEIIDFSSNINPLGIPKNVKKSMIYAIRYTNRYPDINSRELIEAISINENVDKNYIFCSNGAAEAIFRIVLTIKPKCGLVASPTFSEYEKALKSVNASVEYYNLLESNNFKISESILDEINPKIDIMFICNPNNPTGQIICKDLIESIVLKCEKNNVFVVIDECFLDFVEYKEKYTAINLVNKYKNLIILKAFTKIYAIPGVRLGYCISSNKDIIERLKVVGPPWNISNIAQDAGKAALQEKKFIDETIKYVKKQREYLIKELKKINIKTYETYANYILFKFEETFNLQRKLMQYKIFIRSCSNYKNLGNNYYRIAVKDQKSNELFIVAMQEICKKIIVS